jgi:hypothetical protein
MVEKVERILQILTSFEESAAECISEMLIHFTGSNFGDGAVQAHLLITHIDILFLSLQKIDLQLISLKDPQNMVKSKETKQLVKKILYFFSILSNPTPDKKEVTKDMIQLVTSLAYVLKMIIRNSLTAALKLEQIHNQPEYLEELLEQLHVVRNLDSKQYLNTSKCDVCSICNLTIEEECFKFENLRFWHKDCLKCVSCGEKLISNKYIKSENLATYCEEHHPPESFQGLEKVGLLNQYSFIDVDI